MFASLATTYCDTMLEAQSVPSRSKNAAFFPVLAPKSAKARFLSTSSMSHAATLRFSTDSIAAWSSSSHVCIVGDGLAPPSSGAIQDASLATSSMSASDGDEDLGTLARSSLLAPELHASIHRWASESSASALYSLGLPLIAKSTAPATFSLAASDASFTQPKLCLMAWSLASLPSTTVSTAAATTLLDSSAGSVTGSAAGTGSGTGAATGTGSVTAAGTGS